MARRVDDELASAGAAFAGVVGCLTVASLLSLDHGLGQAVPALALMLVVIAAATLGGRLAGVFTAVAAAMSFNFWHTRPYLSMRIHDVADVVTTGLLLVAGLMVGALASARERHAGAAAEERAMLASLAAQADLIAAGADVDEVWAVTRRALSEHLDLDDVRFEPFGTEAAPLPRLTRNDLVRAPSAGPVTVHRLGRRGFLLPPDGAEIALRHHDDPVGRVVLRPRSDGEGLSATARHFALTMAEQFASACATGGARPRA